MLPYNPILDTDSYKLSHFLGYPEDVEQVFSYAESRGGKYPATIVDGLYPYLRKLSENPITREHIDEAEAFAAAHGEPFNRAGWEIILNDYQGALPVDIYAVPEGTLVPTKNVVATVVNMDPRLPWLTSYLETPLLRSLWYASTVATRLFYMKRKLKKWYEATGDIANLDFALLDFSSRGCSSLEANEIGGAAFLKMFKGSDSIPAVRYVNHHYRSEMSGFSVPATEHSIMCSWGEDNELASFEHMIRKYGGPGKIVSVVSDTWNIFEAVRKWGMLAELIHNSGTTLVIRPDSGDMNHVLDLILPQIGDSFGFKTNDKGSEVLNNVKVLWGDGIDEDTCTKPYEVADSWGISADSIMVGSGGGLMQKNLDRDTSKWAFKASAIRRRGISTFQGISKNPITDPGKQSKEGLLKLVRSASGELVTTRARPDDFAGRNELRQTFYAGAVVRSAFDDHDLETIRQRINSQL